MEGVVLNANPAELVASQFTSSRVWSRKGKKTEVKEYDVDGDLHACLRN